MNKKTENEVYLLEVIRRTCFINVFTSKRILMETHPSPTRANENNNDIPRLSRVQMKFYYSLILKLSPSHSNVIFLESQGLSLTKHTHFDRESPSI